VSENDNIVTEQALQKLR